MKIHVLAIKRVCQVFEKCNFPQFSTERQRNSIFPRQFQKDISLNKKIKKMNHINSTTLPVANIQKFELTRKDYFLFASF